MSAGADKRSEKRLTMEDSFTIHHEGSACRVVDISGSGLGVTYIGGENWPGKLTLEFSLDEESGRVRKLKCRTVWESSMDFYKVSSEEIVRRRGLAFTDPAS